MEAGYLGLMGKSSYTGIVRIAPAFIAGIFFAVYYRFDIKLFFFLVSVLFAFPFLFRFFLKKKRIYSFRWIEGICFQLTVFLSAALLTAAREEIAKPSHFSHALKPEAFLAVVNEEPLLKGNNIRFEVQIKEIYSEGKMKNVTGRSLVYVRNDSLSKKPRYGDLILFSKTPVPVKAPTNPGQFNFQKWLQHREIYHQVFLKKNDLSIISSGHGNMIMNLAVSWRNYLLDCFHKAGINGREDAVLSALVLGQDDEIDVELMESYSVSGVLHILAVSGMHVGLIYGAMRSVIRFPGRRRNYIWLKAGLIILGLWLYAMITGLSPSVLRASMMLSLIIIGTGFRRNSNPLNVLSASALGLFLLFSPSLIFSVGFQLSFVAVAGIMFLYKPFHGLYAPRSWIAQQVWSIVSVSIVAQLATFPLSLFYFNRFPNYFIISNLMVIPLSTLIIFGGIILLLLSWWTWFSIFFGKLLSMMIALLNYCIIRLAEIPAASTDDIYLTINSMMLLYVSILFFLLYLFKIRLAYLLYSVATLLILLGISIAGEYRRNTQSFFAIFHIPGHSLIHLTEGKQAVLITDSLLANDKQKRERIGKKFNMERGVKQEQIKSLNSDMHTCHHEISLCVDFPFVQFRNEKIFILNEESKEYSLDNLKPNLIILCGNPYVNPDKWLATVQSKLLIADGSNSVYTIKKWKAACEKAGIAFRDLSISGAFILE